MDGEVQKLLDLLQTVRRRPCMFLWNPDAPFTALVNLVIGYLSALPAEGAPSPATNLLAGCGGSFANWLLQVKESKRLAGDPNLGWPGMIAVSYPTEQGQLDAFFKLLDEYTATIRV